MSNSADGSAGDQSTTGEPAPPHSGAPAHGHWLLLLVVRVAIAAFYCYLAIEQCRTYFPLDASKVGGPGDFEAISASQWYIARTITTYHQLPLWNPFVHSGVPFIGDPYFPVNPVTLVSFLAFDPLNGGKVAAIASLAIAGIGQYWLSRVVGHNRLVSLAAGVVGLSAGSIVSGFSSGFAPIQAQQQAWIAATFAGFIVALRTRRPAAIALSALLYALLYLAGGLLSFEIVSAVLVMLAASYALRRERAVRRLPVSLH